MNYQFVDEKGKDQGINGRCESALQVLVYACIHDMSL